MEISRPEERETSEAIKEESTGYEQAGVSFSPESSGDGGSVETGKPLRQKKRGSRRWVGLFLVGIFTLVLIASGSAYAGYQTGVQQRD
ncbi:MAG: hypothetical protein ACNA8H_11235, partial [Anaerolineales bacterium]